LVIRIRLFVEYQFALAGNLQSVCETLVPDHDLALAAKNFRAFDRPNVSRWLRRGSFVSNHLAVLPAKSWERAGHPASFILTLIVMVF